MFMSLQCTMGGEEEEDEKSKQRTKHRAMFRTTVVSVLTRFVGDLTTNNNVTVSGPVGIRNDDTWGAAVEQTTATFALDINKPLFECHRPRIFLELFIS